MGHIRRAFAQVRVESGCAVLARAARNGGASRIHALSLEAVRLSERLPRERDQKGRAGGKENQSRHRLESRYESPSFREREVAVAQSGRGHRREVVRRGADPSGFAAALVGSGGPCSRGRVGSLRSGFDRIRRRVGCPADAPLGGRRSGAFRREACFRSGSALQGTWRRVEVARRFDGSFIGLDGRPRSRAVSSRHNSPVIPPPSSTFGVNGVDSGRRQD